MQRDGADDGVGERGGELCYGCKRPGELTELVGKLYHDQCTRCAQCYIKTTELTAKLRRQLLYCWVCYQQLFADHCCHCDAVLDGSGVRTRHCRCAPCFGGGRGRCAPCVACRRAWPGDVKARCNMHLFCSDDCATALEVPLPQRLTPPEDIPD